MILSLLTSSLILLILLAGATLGAFYAFSRKPLVIHVELASPAPTISRQIAVPQKPVADLTPIPDELVQYIDQESEEHARVARRQRARFLYAELANWDQVYKALVREDTAS
jgi:hypothetical protein